MEHTPLLTPGLHDFQLDEIEDYFLKNFPASKTRKLLINGLNTYISNLLNIGIPMELWIDGSFTTNKENPKDIDLVIFSSESSINSLPPEKQQLLQILADRDNINFTFGCDVFFCPIENKKMWNYWRKWYGFDKNEQPKGIARVMVTS